MKARLFHIKVIRVGNPSPRSPGITCDTRVAELDQKKADAKNTRYPPEQPAGALQMYMLTQGASSDAPGRER